MYRFKKGVTYKMARSSRQSKIIEIISKQEIETQEELVDALCSAGYDITQATVSRDIKELGLIKIAGETKKYRYAFVGENENVGTNRVANIFRQAVMWVKYVGNLVVIKTLKGTSLAVSNFVDRLAIEHTMGCVCGDDTVMVIVDDINYVPKITTRLSELLLT